MAKSAAILTAAAWAARILPAPIKRQIYRIPPLARFLRAGLNRAAPHGLEAVTVAAGALQGMRLWLDLQSEKDYWLGTYEPELQTALRALASPGMVAYDVGANIGYISLILARLVGETGRVYAFEALPENVKRLGDNLELNAMQSRVPVIHAAVIDSTKAVQFLVGPSGGMGKAQGSAGRRDVAYQQAIDVPGIALDEFAAQDDHLPPQLVKIDIEGGEVLALPGMQHILNEIRPLVLIELHGPEAAEAAWSVLKATGYKICKMQPGFPELTRLEQLDWKAYITAFPQMRR